MAPIYLYKYSGAVPPLWCRRDGPGRRWPAPARRWTCPQWTRPDAAPGSLSARYLQENTTTQSVNTNVTSYLLHHLPAVYLHSHTIHSYTADHTAVLTFRQSIFISVTVSINLIIYMTQTFGNILLSALYIGAFSYLYTLTLDSIFIFTIIIII